MLFFFPVRAIVLASLLLSSATLGQSNHKSQISRGSDQTHSQSLHDRLLQLNRDISAKGLHDFPQSQEKLLTGYAYGEFYDWDLYFENIYLSYSGVSKFDFSNLEVFFDRQEPHGFTLRTLGVSYPKLNQMFKPFLAQLAVPGLQQTDSYE